MDDRQVGRWFEKTEAYLRLLVRRACFLFVAFTMLQACVCRPLQECFWLIIWCSASLAYNYFAAEKAIGRGQWDSVINLFFAAAITSQASLFSGILFQLMLLRICLRVAPEKVPRLALLLIMIYLGSAWNAATLSGESFWRLGYEVIVMVFLAGAARYFHIIMQQSSDNVQKVQELKRSNDFIQRKAVTDELTGLYNFRAYQEKAGKAGPYALLVMDIDYFKKINDSHGHDFGNKVLVRLGSVIRQGLRASDLAFRYGGEEFVILLPGANEEFALQVAERLRGQIEALRFVDKGEAVPVTISIGVAFNHGGCHERIVFEQADSALYKAKREGRNRVEVFEPEIALVCRI